MKKANLSIVFALSLIMTICFIPNILCSNGKAVTDDNCIREFQIENNCSNLVEDYVEISTFPVDLDLLFWSDNLSVREEKLNKLGNGTYGWIITPWGGHFISGHIEGADKWYLYSDRHLEVYAPHDGNFEDITVQNGSVIQINGNDVVVDVGLLIDIGRDCSIHFGHLCILKSIYDKIESENKYSFSENELIGYTILYPDGPAALDFRYQYKYCSVCPYPYLSSELQSKVSTLYNLQYERAKIGGTFPESKLCNNLSIRIENTVWSVWEYHTGPYDDYFEDLDDRYIYEVSLCTILNRNFTNPETFHKEPQDHVSNLTDIVVGVYTDLGGAGEIPGYDAVGLSLVELEEGNFTNGILKLISQEFWNGEVESNQTIYAKISIEKQDIGADDDILTIEYFSNLSDARAGFTDACIKYTRYVFPSPDEQDSEQDDSKTIIMISVAIFAVIVLTLFWFKKRRK